MDIRTYNRTAWDTRVEKQHRWTQPVSSEQIERARQGQFELQLTPTKPVPKEWFPKIAGASILCLASGGGQQGPLLAAAGAVVTVFDNSPKQLDQDRFVAEREQLVMKTVEGDMTDLSMFPDETFDLIVHPCSNCFVPDVRPVWREAFRVLRTDGILMSGFANPLRYLFDESGSLNEGLRVRFPLPYSDLTHLSEAERQRILIDEMQPFEFGHTLTDQIDGQLAAGFLLDGFYEDRYTDLDRDPISRFADTFIATRAVKP